MDMQGLGGTSPVHTLDPLKGVGPQLLHFPAYATTCCYTLTRHAWYNGEGSNFSGIARGHTGREATVKEVEYELGFIRLVSLEDLYRPACCVGLCLAGVDPLW